MTKSALLAAAAVVALSASGASAGTHKITSNAHATAKSQIHHWNKALNRSISTLYDQNDDSQGYSDISQNFESTFDQYDAQGADDFTVPAHTTWAISEVDASGLYFNGSGPARDFHVTFYKNHGGKPGAVVADIPDASYTDVGFGSPVINLGQKVKLKGKGGGKTYWVSIYANMDFEVGGEWGWGTRNDANGNDAQWQNPGDGFATGCTSWSEERDCLGDVGGVDHMFTLRGKSK
ncbi:MAG TPA: hypothetical protein VMF58_13065 [Rhizomicrobium sp.]|nr:hypothetical protein [Rhizomicrobium sp.]